MKMKIENKQSYEAAMARLEELELMVREDTPEDDVYYKELDALITDIDAYESIAYPIAKPSLAATLKLRMHEMGLSQAAMSSMLGVSVSSFRRYLSGKQEPSLHVARQMSSSFNIDPAIVLGV